MIKPLFPCLCTSSFQQVMVRTWLGLATPLQILPSRRPHMGPLQYNPQLDPRPQPLLSAGDRITTYRASIHIDAETPEQRHSDKRSVQSQGNVCSGHKKNWISGLLFGTNAHNLREQKQLMKPGIPTTHFCYNFTWCKRRDFCISFWASTWKNLYLSPPCFIVELYYFAISFDCLVKH